MPGVEAVMKALCRSHVQPRLIYLTSARGQPTSRLFGFQNSRSTPKQLLGSHGFGCSKSCRGTRLAAAIESDAAVEAIDVEKLKAVAEEAAKAGSKVVFEALDKPKNISYKGATDLVTDTDKASEEAVLNYLREQFPQHAFLGEEGGVSGDPSSPYLWAVDPLDGTTNFSHGYPSFGVSVAVVLKGQPVAAAVVEFAGGPHAWVTRTFTASKGGGAFCNGHKLSVSNTDELNRSLLVTGFGYEHDSPWKANIQLFKHFTDVSQGVRRLGAAAIDLCHISLGVADAFWEYRLKPWDVAAGVLLVREAGGQVTTLDGGPFSVFSRSVLASNGSLHRQILEETSPATKKLLGEGVDLSPWFLPTGYQFEEE